MRVESPDAAPWSRDTLTWLGAPGAALADLAFGRRAPNADASRSRHLALLPADALALDLSDPQQSRFGDYELIEPIGEGGMGVVYRARQISLDREVAVKVLAAGPWASRAFVERFRREAQNAARMQHPNIVAIHEVGTAEELHFFSMRLVRGRSLAAEVREHGPFDAVRAARLMRIVAEAVAYAHSLGVLHLDLKPANVLLDEDGVPHVADFGLARRLDSALAVDNDEVSGTPSYMAPEQADGRAGRITQATDIWGLGAILYELIGGEPPFRADDVPSVLRLVREGRVVSLRRRMPRLSRDLEAIVMKCLAREPEARYASARALAEARPLNIAQRLARWTHREPKLAGASMLIVVALVAGLLATTQQWRRAEANAQRAERVRKFMIGVFQEVNPDNSRGQPITAEQLLEHGARELDAPSAQSPAIQADLASTIGRLYWLVGDYPRADAMLARASTAFRSPGVPDEVRARTLLALAFAEKEKNRYEDAITHAREGFAFAEKASDDDDVSAARRLIAESQTNSGDARNAEPLLREALAADRARFGDDADETASDLILLGDALYELSRFDDSIAVEREAADAATRRHGRTHSAVMGALEIESRALRESGHLPEAEQTLREAAAIAERLYGPEHRETIVARSNLGIALQAQGRYAEALQSHLDLLRTVEKMAAERPEQLAYTYNALAADYMGIGDFAKAEDAAQHAIATWRKIHGGDNADSTDSLRSLGSALQWQGRYAEAEQAFRRELALEREHEPQTSGWLNRTRGNLGNLLRMAHRDDEARTSLQAALAALPPQPTVIRATVEAQLALAELEGGDAAAAATLAAESVAAMRKVVPSGNLQLGTPLIASARAALATGDAAQAESLSREAHAVRSPPFRRDDPRVLEADVVRVEALRALGRQDEAAALAAEIRTALAAIAEPIASEFDARLAAAH
jgi:serine/threonine-protein kinase